MRLLPPRRELGWTPYAWLLYLGFFVVTPFLFAASRETRLWTVGAVVVFLPLYFVAYWLRGWRVLLPIAGILLIGAVTAPINPGGSVFFIYAAAFAPQVGTTRRGIALLVVVVTLLALESVALDLPVYFWGPGVLVSLAVGGANLHYAALGRAHRRLLRSQEEVERLAKIAERERIARDLHDLLGHTLSVVTLKAELAARLVTRDPERAAREMRDVEAVSRDALREVRAAIVGYRRQSLAGELDHARRAMETAGIAFAADAEPVELGAVEEGVLALALREAATNVVRHSEAERCTVRLTAAGDGVRLEVADDGRGGDDPFAEGSGLAGMRERVTGLGGRVERVPGLGGRGDGGRGTCLVVTLPATPPHRTRDDVRGAA